MKMYSLKVNLALEIKKSTTDVIFILHALIQKILSRNIKLWCIFIDYERAFDTVNRNI